MLPVCSTLASWRPPPWSSVQTVMPGRMLSTVTSPPGVAMGVPRARQIGQFRNGAGCLEATLIVPLESTEPAMRTPFTRSVPNWALNAKVPSDCATSCSAFSCL